MVNPLFGYLRFYRQPTAKPLALSQFPTPTTRLGVVGVGMLSQSVRLRWSAGEVIRQLVDDLVEVAEADVEFGRVMAGG